MNIKKFLLAWLAGFVVTFLIFGLWHQIIMGDFYLTQTQALTRPERNVPVVVLGLLVLTFLMAYIYPIGYQGGPPLKEGLRFGMLIGLVWILPMSIIIHGIWNYSLISLVVDCAWHVVEQGIAGMAIGLVYGAQQPANDL